MKHLLLILTFSWILSGCSSVTPAESVSLDAVSGNHYDAINRFETDIGSFDQWDAEKSSGWFGQVARVGMGYLCESYLEVRDFSTAKKCMQHWKQTSLPYLKETQGEKGEHWFYAYSAQINTLYYLELGDYRQAYAHYEQAVKHNYAYTKDHCETGMGIARLARLKANGGVAAAQLNMPEQAKNIAASIDCIESVGVELETARDAKVKNASKARIYLALEDYPQAKEAMLYSPDLLTSWGRLNLLLLTVGMSEMIGMGEEFSHPYSFDETYMLGKIALGNRELKEAEYIFNGLLYDPEDKTRHSAALLNRPGIYYQLLFDLGSIAEQNGQPDKALDYYRQAVAIIEEQRQTINTEGSKIGFIGNKERVYQSLVALLIKQGITDEAFVYAERSKARALVDILASKREFAPRTMDQQPAQLIARLDQFTARQHSPDATAGSSRVRGIDRGLLRKLKHNLQDSQPELASLVTVSAPELTRLQHKLAPDETLLEYYGDADTLYAFLLTRQGVKVSSLNGKDLDTLVKTLRQELMNPKRNAYQHYALTLYQRLIQPVKHELHTTKLTIVPHGSLHYLPFNTLYDGSKFLIDQYEISILPSASVMEFLDKRSDTPKELLVLGNPQLDDQALDLPGAESEAKSIAARFTSKTLLLRGNASETAVKAQAEQYKYLHFASHGIFEPQQPLTSGLLLAKDAHNDGMLTVSELYELNLNADLVTLSACETGLGQVANGDDVVGFTRGLLYAGTNSIVSSLWKVDDQATSMLMKDFYTRLQASKDKRQALRRAQLKVKQQYHRHPYYWAAFQLTGH